MLRTLLALALLALAPAAAAQEAPAEPGAAISTDDAAGTDGAIERRIAGILRELGGYEGVTVSVREGIVTFRGEVLDPAALAELDALAARVDGVVATRNDAVESTDVRQRLDPVRERAAERFRQSVAYLPLLAVALVAGLVVASLGVALARWDRLWARLAPNAFIGNIYRVVLRLAFVLAGVVVALDILGATALLAGLFGAAGIIGLAVGFAVRDTVENFIASVMLSLRQPFRPHDVVDVDGTIGSVIRLTSRATILLDPDGNHVRLPNASVFKAKIVNYTRNDTRRFGFGLGIDPADDLGAARRIGIETMAGLDFVLADPPPMAWVEDAGDSTVTMTFHGWIDQREANWPVARGEALRAVMAALTREGIGLPEPSYRLNIAGGGLPVIDMPDQGGRSGEMVVTEGEPVPPDAVAPDPTIERMVHADRRHTADRDLLDASSPPE